ncbi:MAG: hypothetical protein E7050_01285 [Lentisphaerae bacterium]|nr:hypothetical protein [Lentisphaerota bacterium]
MGIFVCRRFLLTAAAGCAGICLMTGVTGCANWKMEREFRTALQFKAAGKNEQMLQKLQLAAHSNHRGAIRELANYYAGQKNNAEALNESIYWHRKYMTVFKDHRNALEYAGLLARTPDANSLAGAVDLCRAVMENSPAATAGEKADCTDIINEVVNTARKLPQEQKSGNLQRDLERFYTDFPGFSRLQDTANSRDGKIFAIDDFPGLQAYKKYIPGKVSVRELFQRYPELKFFNQENDSENDLIFSANTDHSGKTVALRYIFHGNSGENLPPLLYRVELSPDKSSFVNIRENFFKTFPEAECKDFQTSVNSGFQGFKGLWSIKTESRSINTAWGKITIVDTPQKCDPVVINWEEKAGTKHVKTAISSEDLNEWKNLILKENAGSGRVIIDFR